MCGQTTKYLIKLNVKTAMGVKNVFQTTHVYSILMQNRLMDFMMLDVGLISILAEHRLYEHFCQDEVHSVLSMDIILQLNDPWAANLKMKMKILLV